MQNRPIDKNDPFGLTNTPGDFGYDVYDPDFYNDDGMSTCLGGGLLDPGNWLFLIGWATGSSDEYLYYWDEDRKSQEMSRSAGVGQLRDKFYADGCSGVKDFNYDPMPGDANRCSDSATAAQVAGFDEAMLINNGDGTMTFIINNTAGTKSAFGHKVGDMPSWWYEAWPLDTVYQQFQWSEEIDTSRCCDQK